MRISGKVSWFGGPNDTGVAPDEGLAFIDSVDDAPHLFLPQQPPGTTGLARRLNPEKFYIACRWDYDAPDESKAELLRHVAHVYAPSTGKRYTARPADWGPNNNTGRVADLSPGLLDALGIETDDVVEVTYPYEGEPVDRIHRVAISAGHGKHVDGASGYIDEAEETPRVMEAVAAELRARGVTTKTFWDQTSTTQQQNLDAIIGWHNAQTRDLDVSIHFNCSNGNMQKPIGTECLYVTQDELAAAVSAAIATTGLIDRGAKYNSNLAFLNGTTMPAILIEVLFVNSEADVDIYAAKFDAICAAIAIAVAGEAVRPPAPVPAPVPVPVARITIEIAGVPPENIQVTIK